MDKALEVYRKLLAAEPGNAEYADKVRELEMAETAQTSASRESVPDSRVDVLKTLLQRVQEKTEVFMNFEAELRSVLERIPGSHAAVLMGFDGIPVAEAKAEGPELAIQDATVEYSRLLSEAMKVAQGHNLGAVNEIVINSDKYRFVFRVLDHQYFVGLLLSSNSMLCSDEGVFFFAVLLLTYKSNSN